MLTIMRNLGWLSFKKVKSEIFRKFLVVSLNFLLFQTMTLAVGFGVYRFILLIVTLSNTLFLYVKIERDVEVVSLLRSIGASKRFIYLHHLSEVGLLYVVSVLVALPLLILRPLQQNALLWGGGEFLYLLGVTFIFTQITLNRVERLRKVL